MVIIKVCVIVLDANFPAKKIIVFSHLIQVQTKVFRFNKDSSANHLSKFS